MTNDANHQSPVSVPEGNARALADALADEIVMNDRGSHIELWIHKDGVALITAALLSAESRGERKGIEKAAKVVLSRRYGPPSMWGSANPQGWHLDRQCSPTDASMHDNGVIDAFKAVRALSASPSPNLQPPSDPNIIASTREVDYGTVTTVKGETL